MPVYNGVAHVARSLPPLLQMQRCGEIQEVIVVDDSSTDRSPELAAELGARVLASGGRLGPAAARNLAAGHASGEILWFVDADVVVHQDIVGYLRQAFSEPGVVAMFGCYDNSPAAPNFLSQYKNLAHRYYHKRSEGDVSTFWAGCGAVLKKTFLEVGGFDAERFKRPSIEDIELGYRIRKGGGRVKLVSGMQCTHLKEWRFGNLLTTEIFSRALPWSRLMLAESGVLDSLNVTVGERMRALIAVLFFVTLAGSIKGAWAAWLPIAVVCILVMANREIFGFFANRRGIVFAIRAVAFHQIHYLYSSAAFIWCWLEVRLSGKRPV